MAEISESVVGNLKTQQYSRDEMDFNSSTSSLTSTARGQQLNGQMTDLYCRSRGNTEIERLNARLGCDKLDQYVMLGYPHPPTNNLEVRAPSLKRLVRRDYKQPCRPSDSGFIIMHELGPPGVNIARPRRLPGISAQAGFLLSKSGCRACMLKRACYGIYCFLLVPAASFFPEI
jgi:hypothetical protein